MALFILRQPQVLAKVATRHAGTEDTPGKVERFKEAEFIKSKWGEALRRDPCYSPHLTLAREDFSLGEV